MHSQKAFTLVELVVVVTIMSILATVATMGYNSYLSDARDSARLADAGSLRSNLRAHKQKKGMYPMPVSAFAITYSGSKVATQGIADDSIDLSGISHMPKDPRIDRYYGYSVTKNRQAYEVAMTMEKNDDLQAYVDGDYKTVAKNILPSLFLAADTTADTEIGSGSVAGAQNRKKFLLDGSTASLLYNMRNQLVARDLPVDGLGNFEFPANVRIPIDSGFESCDQISDAGRSIGAGEYQIRSLDGNTITSTGCTGTGFSM